MSSLIQKLQQSSRTVAAAALTALLAAWSPVAAFAQNGVVAGQQQQTGQVTGQQQNPPAQNSITQAIPGSPEVPKDRVGIRPGEVQLLALQEAIAQGLQNNLDIEQFRQGVRISEFSLFSLRGFYDYTSGAGIGFRSSINPTSSSLSGGNSGTLSSKSLYYNFTTSKQFEATGGNLFAEFDNSRNLSSNIFASLNPQYNTTLTFTFTQPLLRNFSLDAQRRSIKLAQKSLDLSDSQFRQRVIEIINQVQRAYWDLVFAIQNEKIARDSVDLAKTQLDNNRKMVEAGTLAPIELRSTEAQLETAKGNVIVALQGITTAENALKILLLKDPNDKIWYSEISPTDQPDKAYVAFSLEESTRLALKNRPELEQMRLQTEQKEIDIKYYTNQLKPQLDLIGTYANTGLAGAAQNAVVVGGGGGSTVLPRFQGGYFQSLKNLFGQDFRTYQVGVQLSFPWRNRTAKANLGRTLAEQRQLDARQRQLVETVQVDVRNALQAVVASKQRFEAAQAGELAAMAQYSGEQERYRAGLSTNFVVLQRLTDLSVARGTTVRALTDYNKALADLQRVTGMTLVSNNVEISSKPTDAKK
ncbi:MAG TPA: TolC family protein [Blastocatellia bacterium]|nr:TolC family protein [Blastocatellia bacterium]